MEKPEGKLRHAGEPEASVPWEELRVTAFLFKDSTGLFERSWWVWCGQQPVLGILGEPLQPPESQGYQPEGSLRSRPSGHPTLLLTTTSQQRKQGEAQASAHSSL